MSLKDVDITIKAAYLCGLYAGTNGSSLNADTIAFRKDLRPHAITAAKVAFGGGELSLHQVWEMEKFYDRIVDVTDRLHAERVLRN